MVDPAPVARRRTSWRARFGVAVASGLGTLALLEVGLWLLAPLPPLPPTRSHRFLPSWTAIGPAPRTLSIDPGPLPGVTPGRVEYSLNRLGYLYPDAAQRRASPDEVRVAIVGGSTVECSMLAPDKRVSALLEQRLQAVLLRPVTVLNLGTSAQDTRTHLATTAHVVTDLDVDVCVFLLGANDLGITTMTEHPMLEASAFYPSPRLSHLLKNAWRRTQIGRHLHHWRNQLPGERTTPYFAEAAALQASLPALDPPPVPTPTGLAHYARNVVSLAGLCQEHGIAPLFATQPCMFPAQPTPEELQHYWGCHSATHAMRAVDFASLLDTVNAHLLATCRQHGYPCVDVAGEVPKGLGFFYDQVHWNEPGAQRVAGSLVEPVRALLR